VLSGREGAERYPQATDVGIEAALYRSLRPLDPEITLSWARNMAALYDEEELIAARNATTLARPANVRAYFQSRLKKIIPVETANGTEKAPTPLRPLPVGDPYES
jgi:hypothetical protein